MPPVTKVLTASPDRCTAWLAAARPKTLSIGVTPVLVGVSLAYADAGQVIVDALLATLAGAVLIQIGTNLHNDAADHDSGADRPGQRLGPPRAAAQGWLSSREVRMGALLCFVLAFLIGCYLVARGGWPILAIGLASLLAGFAYSGGPWRISYSSLGELFVLAFFGLAAVGGTYYLQTGTITVTALVAGLFVGAPASAVLVVNNHRDREEDARVGRCTLSIVLGEPGTKLAFAAILLMPFALLPALGETGRFWWWLPALMLPWAVGLVRQLWTQPVGAGLNEVLGETARFQLALGLALSMAWLAPVWVS